MEESAKKTEEKDILSNYIIFHINSGPEKDIVGTSVVNSLKELHPNKKIVIVTHFPEIWLHNPDVYRVYKFGATPYFYDDFVNGKDSEIYAGDPYLTSDYINNTKPIAEIWCELIGIVHNGSDPKIYFTQREEEVAYRILQNQKPILLIQGNSIIPNQPGLDFDWTKDLPIYVLQKISDEAIRKGYSVIQIRNENHAEIAGAVSLTLNLRMSIAILKNIKKCLFVDSFMQHAAAAMGKSSVVTWLSSSPELNGYNMHKNISGTVTLSIEEDLSNYSDFFDMNKVISSKAQMMEGVYNADEIINTLEL